MNEITLITETYRLEGDSLSYAKLPLFFQFDCFLEGILIFLLLRVLSLLVSLDCHQIFTLLFIRPVSRISLYCLNLRVPASTTQFSIVYQDTSSNLKRLFLLDRRKGGELYLLPFCQGTTQPQLHLVFDLLQELLVIALLYTLNQSAEHTAITHFLGYSGSYIFTAFILLLLLIIIVLLLR